MTAEENRKFMKDFFERYYIKRKSLHDLCVSGVAIPDEMLADGADPNKELNIWKLTKSVVTEEDINKIEMKLNIKLPECIKAFFSVYHHRFEDPVGRNDIRNPFYDLERAYTHHLADNGYLPFGWDGESIFIRCIDLSNIPNEEKCPVLEIDHEYFFDLQFAAEDKGILVPKEQLEPLFSKVADNFYEYLNGIYNDVIE
ncbi:MAG: SMI1/KNR4 family protein [Oscillospiraceae bacterium]|nr:SMI1/KNR4 family protein [Oscillospiraceae bacterium]